MKRILLILLMVAMLTIFFAISTSAAEPVEVWDISATENDNVIACLYEDEQGEDNYTLVIRGTGDSENTTLFSLPNYVMYRAKVKSAIVENGITSIWNSLFDRCDSLTSIAIPETLSEIKLEHLLDIPFSNCSLVSIEVSENNMSYCCIDGNLYSKDKSVLIRYSSGKEDKRFEIPKSVKNIGRGAFCGSNAIKEIVIPDGVSRISEAAFLGCTGIESIMIPKSVTYVGGDSFGSCSDGLIVYVEGNTIFGGDWMGSSGDPTRCQVVTNCKSALFKDIFLFKGYSVSENGAIAAGFDIDYEAIEAYERLSGLKVDIGIVFAGYENLNGANPLHSNGAPITLNEGKVVKLSLSNLDYTQYDFVLRDITEAIADVSLVISGYVFDGMDIKYVQGNSVSETVTGISYNEIRFGCLEHNYYMKENGKEGVHYIVLVAPTCYSNGTKCYICTKCGEVGVETGALPSVFHEYINGECKYCGREDPFYDEEL